MAILSFTAAQVEDRWKNLVLLVALALMMVVVIGWMYHAATPVQEVNLTLAFLSGITMIFLPCTFPLVLALAPLTMGLRYSSGFIAALIFGIGTSVTMAMYTMGTAAVGQYLHLDTFTRAMWFLGGALALLFGLSELGLIKLRLPSFGLKVPRFIEGRSIYVKALLLGLLLGNLGVDCPCPAFYVILVNSAQSGSLAYGASMGFVHGLGRVVPLLVLAVFAMAGVNVVQKISRGRSVARSAMAWGLVGIGAWMIAMHAVGHDWYEESWIHVSWNNAMMGMGHAGNVGEVPHAPGEHNAAAYWYAPWLFIGLVAAPAGAVIWKRRSSDANRARAGREQAGPAKDECGCEVPDGGGAPGNSEVAASRGLTEPAPRGAALAAALAGTIPLTVADGGEASGTGGVPTSASAKTASSGSTSGEQHSCCSDDDGVVRA